MHYQFSNALHLSLLTQQIMPFDLLLEIKTIEKLGVTVFSVLPGRHDQNLLFLNRILFSFCAIASLLSCRVCKWLLRRLKAQALTRLPLFVCLKAEAEAQTFL